MSQMEILIPCVGVQGLHARRKERWLLASTRGVVLRWITAATSTLLSLTEASLVRFFLAPSGSSDEQSAVAPQGIIPC